VLECDLQDVNREASLAVHFLPSTKHILLMPFGVDFEGLRDQSSKPPILSSTKKSHRQKAFEFKLNLEKNDQYVFSSPLYKLYCRRLFGATVWYAVKGD
jgi:hypothetical protein